MPLTDAAIRALKPKEKSYKVADFEGLFLKVNPTGSRLWQFKYRIDSKEKLLSFGAYPEVSLAQARAKKDEARRLNAGGQDPAAAKKDQQRQDRAKRGNTFEAMARDFMAKGVAEDLAPATQVKNEYYLRMAIASFGRRPITEVSAPIILECLRRVEAKGIHHTANRLRSKIGAVFRYAIAVGLADTDPTSALKGALIRPKVKHRAAITNVTKLGGFLRALDGYSGQVTTRLGLNLLAITAQRPGDIRLAKWGEFDMAAKIWSVPADRTKMRRPHQVPLPAKAMTLLDELRLQTGSGEYLFPSIRSSMRPMSENTLNSALRIMGYTGEEVTSHGFRATFSTLANESGLWNPDAIERAVAHEDKDEVRKAYVFHPG